MPGALTRELVVARSKTDNLFAIKNLNVWGNEIDDVKILTQLPNVEVLSLSVNRISTLKDFSRCHKLQELYLRKNNIGTLDELRYIAKLPELRVLWLKENPCASVKNYREKVIRILPNLSKLDDQAITPDERRLAGQTNIDDIESPESEGEEVSPSPVLKKEPVRAQVDRNEVPIQALKQREYQPPANNQKPVSNPPRSFARDV